MSSNLRSKAAWKTGISFVLTVAAGIVLNILGTRLNALMGLSLFIDDIGTILSARVMAVAVVFDALISRRSYKEPFTIEKALDIIREDAEEEVRRVAKLNMEP